MSRFQVSKQNFLGGVSIALAAFFILMIPGASNIALALVCMSVIFCVPKNKLSYLDPTLNMFLALLLLLSAYPLAASYFTGRPLLSLNYQRDYFSDPDAIVLALEIVLLQASVIFMFARSVPGQGVVSKMSTTTMSTQMSADRLVLSFLLVIFSVLSNPGGFVLGGGYGTDEVKGDYFLFSGWPLIFIVTISFYMARFGIRRIYDWFLVYMLSIYWMLHGNRSEVAFLVLLPPLAFMSSSVIDKLKGKPLGTFFKYRARFRPLRLMVVGVCLFAVIAIMQLVGLYRGAGSIEGMLEAQAYKESQHSSSISTIGPSAYTLTSTIVLLDTGSWSHKFGATYLDYLTRILPSVISTGYDRKEDLSVTLMRDSGSIGGVHFAAEAFLNFGLIGSIAFAFLVAICFSKLSKSRGNKFIVCFNILCIYLYLPRFVLYGNIYVFKLLMVLIVANLLLHYFFSNRRKRSPRLPIFNSSN